MRRTQKLESLGVMAGGIAHDLNNLLTSIVGNAELARLDLPEDAPSRESLEYVDQAAQLAAELCRQLLAYAGRGTLDTVVVDAAKTVDELRALLASSVEQRGALEYELGATETFVADLAQFQQVLLNLVINAGEALDKSSGVVTIRTGTRTFASAELKTPYGEKSLEAGRYTYVEVSDDGVGMDGVTRERLFDPFYTTKFTGRGLGLSAVLGIVRAHGGCVQVESGLGVGSLFRVLFPVATAVVGRVETEEAPGALASVARRRVLLVDDEALVREVSARQLERLGFEVLVCGDGAQALRSFSDHRDDIAFVLLDLTMPGMSGIETLRALREVDAEVRVLLMSGYSESEAIGAFAELEPNQFLQKPFTGGDLMTKMRLLLDGAEPPEL